MEVGLNHGGSAGRRGSGVRGGGADVAKNGRVLAVVKRGLGGYVGERADPVIVHSLVGVQLVEK